MYITILVKCKQGVNLYYHLNNLYSSTLLALGVESMVLILTITHIGLSFWNTLSLPAMFLHPLASATPTGSSGKSTPPHLFCAQSRAKAFKALPVCNQLSTLSWSCGRAVYSNCNIHEIIICSLNISMNTHMYANYFKVEVKQLWPPHNMKPYNQWCNFNAF